MNEKVLSLTKSGTYWLPESISNFGQDVDSLFYFILWCSVAFFVGIVGVSIYFLVHYHQSKKNSHLDTNEKEFSHNNAIEITWTVLPLILVMVIFVWGYKGYLNMAVIPENGIDVRVNGRKWVWNYTHTRTGKTDGAALVVPVNYPIKLTMSSVDVLHSFFLPNLRIKRDVIPNRYTILWFEANKIGSYPILCTEYCGTEHSNMLSVLKVVSMEDYQVYANSTDENMTPLELGKKYYKGLGCSACHSIDGSDMIGPTWKGLYGKLREFSDGTSTIADENYIRESIIYPNKRIVKGYPAGAMNSYKGQKDIVIDGIIEYIKTLK